tara:strand:+ start:19 stop:2475 length:2457 start_codon:yes stop_codon:yes gene_type:complete
MIPGQAQQFFEAAAAQSGGSSSYEIERSLRFNSGDTAYLNKTLSSGNRRTWTLSFWVKRWNQSSTTDGIFCAYNGSISEDNYAIVQFGSDDQFYVTYAYANYIRTTRVFRDPSSWYHIVVVVDTNNSTAGDRVQLYVNGVRETDFAASHDPDAGQELAFNQACPHYIGSEVGQFYSDCYYAEMHFVDGTALGPTDFGEFDDNNNWNAKEYTGGSYGTNGFYLKFNDNSSASALGTDSSGNSNTWTVNNLSVSAGVDNDSLLDSPTDGDTANDTGAGGQIPGNYCVINNLGRSANNPTVSDGNLKMVLGSAQGTRHGTMGVTSGKWYFEVVYTAATAFDGMVGVANKNHENNLGNYIGGDSDSWGYYYNGQKYHPGQSGAYGDGWTTGDVMGIALDMDNGALYFSKNGTYQNSGDPTSGASKTGAAFTNLSGTIFPGLNGYGGTQYVNFGQRPFNTSAPSGYKTWNTANLPTPAIADGATALNATLWTGTGSSRSITGYGFAPDFVWIKCRNNTASHALLDIVRGSSQVLRTDTTAAQTNNTTVWTSFDSDGFTLGADTTNGWTNYNTWTYVGYAWKAGSSTVTVAKDANGTNLPGAECQVRANTTNGTSIVVVANPQSNEARVHGLNAAPDFFICKSTASADSWHCYWSVLGRTKYINLNGTGPANTSDQFGSQEPDSTYFYVKSNTGSGANKSGGMVYYLFTTVEGYSSFGKFTGNGNSDGPFISTGFRPKWVLIKSSSDTGNWGLWDTERDTFNVSTKRLQPQSGAAESGSDPNVYIDILSNGFKIRNSDTDSNGSSREYIYAAFAEHPFKTARAR